MLLMAGNDNEILDRDNAEYMDGYEYNPPEEVMQKIYEYKMKMKYLWIEYLKSLEKERTYAVQRFRMERCHIGWSDCMQPLRNQSMWRS